jgi:TusA-related sulfurtransferase
MAETSTHVAKVLDARGLSCPLPVLKLAKAMKELEVGAVLEMHATDPGSRPDVEAWCRSTGNELVAQSENEGVFVFHIRRSK